MRPRRTTLLAIAALVVALLSPLGPSARATATGSKIAPSLQGIIDHQLGDQLYGDVVPGHVPGTVYYLAKVGSTDAVTLQAIAATGATVRHRFDVIGWVSLSSPSAAVARVAALPQVSRLVADRVLHLSSASTEAVTGETFADQSKRGTHDIGADAEWAKGITGNGVTVGVVDSGIDGTHPDLQKIDTFVNCMGVVPSVLTDVDDIGSCVPQPLGNDDNGHGTHVSGIAAGSGAGNSALPGVAPSARLAGAKVCNPAGSCLNSSVMAGINTLATPAADGGAGANVINISLGGGPSYAAYIFGAEQQTDLDAEAQLLDALADKYNVVFAVAAGNAGPTLQSVGSPSTASQVIAVGASVTDFDRNASTEDTLHGMNGNVSPDAAAAGVSAIATFSSRGPSGDRQIKPDLTAPGSYYVSAEDTAPGEVKAADAVMGNHYSTDPTYAVLSGTSMASPAAAGSAALVIDGYHTATGNSPRYYVVKAAMANTAHARAFEGPITGLISSLKSNRLGMDPYDLFPPRNDADVGVTGTGAGRVYVPDAILASTAGVTIYTTEARNADKLLTTDAFQPSWAMDDLAPGQSSSQKFVLNGGPKMANTASTVTLKVEAPTKRPEAVGVKAAPSSWFSLPSSVTVKRGSDAGRFSASLKVPANAAPGQYTATIVGTASIGKGVTQNIRIPVQFFVPMKLGTQLTGPIWASDVTDYSIVGFENPLGQIYTDWSMVPVRVPTTGAKTLTFNVWDPAGASTMDVFAFHGNDGTEAGSTVDEPLHAVPAGAALTPTTADAPGTFTVTVVAPDAELGYQEVHAGEVLWVVLSDTKPANVVTFETSALTVTPG
jgi:serine protease AprX